MVLTMEDCNNLCTSEAFFFVQAKVCVPFQMLSEKRKLWSSVSTDCVSGTHGLATDIFLTTHLTSNTTWLSETVVVIGDQFWK